jgi:hypothetical protein
MCLPVIRWGSYLVFCHTVKVNWGPGSSVGIATSYGLDGPGIECQWGRDFPHLSRPALGPTQPPVQWVPGLLRRQREAGAWSWPLTPFLYHGPERVELYLYSPYGPYGPYRAILPVQRLSACTRVHFKVNWGNFMREEKIYDVVTNVLEPTPSWYLLPYCKICFICMCQVKLVCHIKRRT